MVNRQQKVGFVAHTNGMAYDKLAAERKITWSAIPFRCVPVSLKPKFCGWTPKKLGSEVHGSAKF
jgi:hypothetical protein